MLAMLVLVSALVGAQPAEPAKPGDGDKPDTPAPSGSSNT